MFLLQPYLDHCQHQRIPPNVHDAMHWMQQAPNPTHKYMCEITFTHLLSLFMYRQGVRNRDPSIVLFGETTLSELFYGTHITTYMELYHRHITTYLKAPSTSAAGPLTQLELFTKCWTQHMWRWGFCLRRPKQTHQDVSSTRRTHTYPVEANVSACRQISWGQTLWYPAWSNITAHSPSPPTITHFSFYMHVA